jgi:hypothetical protein
MSRLGWTTSVVALCAVACSLIAVHGASASTSCVPGTTPQRACPLTGTVSASLPGSGADYYYKLWARKGTEIRLTLNNTEDPGCSTGSAPPGGCLLECAMFTQIQSRSKNFPCSIPSDGLDRPASEQVTVPHTGVFYISLNTEAFRGGGTQPYSLKVLANPGVRWPPPCVVPRLPHDTFLSVAESKLRHDGCRVGRIRHVRDRHTHGGDVVSLGLRRGSIHPRGTRVAVTVAAR